MGKKLNDSRSFDLQTLDLLLDSIVDAAAHAGTTRQDFYTRSTVKLKAGTDSLVAMVWVSDGQRLRIVGHSGWDACPVRQKEQVQKFVKESIDSGSSASQRVKDLPFGRVYSGTCKPANRFQFLFLLIQPPREDELLGQVLEDLVIEVVGQIEIFENSRFSESPQGAIREVSNLAQLVQGLGRAANLTQLAFHLANDLAIVSKADRVSFHNARGKIKAISGVSEVSHKTGVVRQLKSLASKTLSSKEAIEWSNGEINFEGKRMPRGLPKTIESIGTPIGYTFPCISEGKCYGALVFEFFSEEFHSVEQRRMMRELVDFSSPVIARATQLLSIPGIGFQNFFFNGLLGSRVRSFLWLIASAIALGLAWYFLFLVPNPFEIHGEGILQPVRRQHVYAKTDGEIKDLLVIENSAVMDGQPLIHIDSRSLEKDIIQVEGEIAEVQQQLKNLTLTEVDGDVDDPLQEEAKRASEIERLKIRLQGHLDRLAVLEEKQQYLKVTSPIDGKVVTTDLRRRLLDRPISRGDLLMTIAQTDGEWEVELAIADNRIEFIEKAMRSKHPKPLQVELRLMSNASESYLGQLESLDYRSQEDSVDGMSRVKATISMNEEDIESSLRIGTRVLGKVRCGQRNNFYLLTYELNNRIREYFFW